MNDTWRYQGTPQRALRQEGKERDEQRVSESHIKCLKFKMGIKHRCELEIGTKLFLI